MTNESRAAFEAWKKTGLFMSRNNTPGTDLEGYQDTYTNMQWQAWQASREVAIYETVGKAVGIIHENAKGCSRMTESILLSQADAIKELLNDQTIKNRKNPVRCAKP
jgi:hypothetical protein